MIQSAIPEMSSGASAAHSLGASRRTVFGAAWFAAFSMTGAFNPDEYPSTPI